MRMDTQGLVSWWRWLLAAWTVCAGLLAQQPLAPGRARVVGFCYAKYPRVAVASCEVTVLYRGAVEPGDAATVRQRTLVRAGEDGIFEVDVLARPGVEVELWLRHPDYAEDRYWAGSLRAGATYRCGLRCLTGVALRGVVRDVDGAPQKIAFDLVSRRGGRPSKGPSGPRPGGPPPEPFPHLPKASAPFRRVWWEERYGDRVRVQSDEDGAFVVPERLWARGYEVRPVDPELCPRPIVWLPDDQPQQQLTISVERRPYLAGRCVDQDGRPVEGVAMRLPGSHRELEMGVVTGADGAFVLPRYAGGRSKPRIRIYTCGDCVPVRATPELTWGDHEIEIPLQRWGTVPMRVVDHDTGAPIEDYAVRVWQPGVFFHGTAMRLRGGHRDGRLDVTVPDGPGWIAVVPNDPRWTCEVVAVHAKQSQAPIEVRVQRMVPMSLTIVGPGDTPIAGEEVQMVVRGDEGTGPGEAAWMRGKLLSGLPDEVGMMPARALSRATTDAEGRCVLLGIPGRSDLCVRVVRSMFSNVWGDGVVGKAEAQRVVVR